MYIFQQLGIVLRQIRRSAFFSILKIVGLCIGFTVFIVLLSMVRKELSYDDFWTNKGKLYRVALEQHKEGQLQMQSARNYQGMSELLMQEFPEVENRVRIYRDMITLFAEEEQIQDVDMFYCDTTLLSVLPLKILDAESSSPFSDVHATIISESLALKLFGTSDVIGRELKLNEGWKFYVSAVFEDIPANSHLKADMFLYWKSLHYYIQNYDVPSRELIENPEFVYSVPSPNQAWAWNNRLNYNYIIIKEGVDVEALEAKARKLLETFKLPDRFSDTRIIPHFQAVEDIHLHSDYSDELGVNSSMFRIYMLVLIACIVLVISLVNFINLYAIDFYEKSKDLAVRVINGAGSRHIMGLIWQRGLVLCLISAFFAINFIYLASIWISSMDPINSFTFILLFSLIAMSTLLTVIIPMVGYKAGSTMDHLKGRVLGKMKGKNFRRILVALQFISSIVLISSTIIIYLQMDYTRTKNLGFNPEHVIYSYSPMTMNMNPEIPRKLIQFKNAMEQDPSVLDFSVSSSIPGKPLGFPGFTVFRSTGDTEKESVLFRMNIDAGYLETYGMEMLAGDNFRDDHNYQTNDIIINRSAAELLGFKRPEDALGEALRVGENLLSISGVVEDYHHLSFKSEYIPTVFFKNLWWHLGVGFYSFKLAGDEADRTDLIARTWAEIYPGEKFIFSTMESTFLEQYEADQAFGRSFMYAAILAILVSCLGLLGLSKYNAIRRTREIGIRKTFGASSSSILLLLQSETIVLILISAVMGIPVAWLITDRWLNTFMYHISAKWWMFFIAVLLTLIVAFVSASILSIRTARANPIDSIRYE